MVLLGFAAYVLIVVAMAWWLVRAPDFWNRFAAAGFLLVPLALVVQIAAGNLTGVFATPLPLTLASLIMVVILLAAKRLYVAGFILALLTFLAFLLLGLFGLSHSDSFGDFAPAVLSVGGAVFALIGTWNGWHARRRGSLHPAPHRAASVWAGAGVLVAIALTSALLTFTGSATARVPSGAQLIIMRSDSFDPDVLHASAGQPITVFVRNVDAYAHTFAVDGTDIDVYVAPRRNKQITFSVPDAALKGEGRSKLSFSCTVTGHDDMRGTLEVVR